MAKESINDNDNLDNNIPDDIYIHSSRMVLNPFYSYKWIAREYELSRNKDFLHKIKEEGWELVFEKKHLLWDSFWRRKFSSEEIEERKYLV